MTFFILSNFTLLFDACPSYTCSRLRAQLTALLYPQTLCCVPGHPIGKALLLSFTAEG